MSYLIELLKEEKSIILFELEYMPVVTVFLSCTQYINFSPGLVGSFPK